MITQLTFLTVLVLGYYRKPATVSQKKTLRGRAKGLTISTGPQEYISNEHEHEQPSVAPQNDNLLTELGNIPEQAMNAVSGMGIVPKPADLLSEIPEMIGLALGRKVVSQVPIRVVSGQTFGAALDRQDQVTSLNDFECVRAVGEMGKTFNTDTDEMQSDFFTRRFFYVRTLNVSNTPGDLSDSIDISPCQTQTVVNVLDEPRAMIYTPLEFFTRLFGYWRGGIEISLQYIAPRDVTMRFWVCIGYGRDWDEAPTYEDALQMPGVFAEFDSNNRQQNIEIPYVCPDLWAVPEGQNLTGDSGFSDYQEDFNKLGTVFIYTTAAPSGPQVALGSTPATQLNLWIRGADDFDVRVLQPQPFLNFQQYAWPTAVHRKEVKGKAKMMKNEAVGGADQPPAPVIAAVTSDVAKSTNSGNTELIAEGQNTEVRRPDTKIIASNAGTRSAVVAPLDLVNLNERPILVESWVLGSSVSIGILKAFVVPEDYMLKALKYMFQAAQYWRGDLVLRFHVISTGWNGGMVAVSYIPGLYANEGLIPSEYENPVRLLSLKNMITIDLSSNQPVELIVPYQAQTDWVNTDSTQTPSAWGTVVVYLLNQVQAGSATSGSQSVTLQMHAQWKNIEAVIRKPIASCAPVFTKRNRKEDDDSVIVIPEVRGKAKMEKSDPVSKATTQTQPYTAVERDTRYSVTPIVVTKQKVKPFKINKLLNRPTLVISGVTTVSKGVPTLIDLPQPNELDLSQSGGGLFGLLRPLFAGFRGDCEFIINLKTKDAATVSVCCAKVNSYDKLSTSEVLSLLPTPLEFSLDKWLVPARLAATFAGDNYTVPACVPTVLTNLPSTLHVMVPFYSCKRFTAAHHVVFENDCYTQTNQSRVVLGMWMPADVSEDTVEVEYQIFMVIPETAAFGYFQGIPPVYPDCEIAFDVGGGSVPVAVIPIQAHDYPGTSIVAT